MLAPDLWYSAVIWPSEEEHRAELTRQIADSRRDTLVVVARWVARLRGCQRVTDTHRKLAQELYEDLAAAGLASLRVTEPRRLAVPEPARLRAVPDLRRARDRDHS